MPINNIRETPTIETTLLKGIQEHLNHNQKFTWSLLSDGHGYYYLTISRVYPHDPATIDIMIRIEHAHIRITTDHTPSKINRIPLSDPNLFERIVTIVNETN